MPMIITNEFQKVGPVGIGSQNPALMQHSPHIPCVCFHLRPQRAGEIRPHITNELCHNSFQEDINRVGAIGKIKTLIYFPIIYNKTEAVCELQHCPLCPYLQILFWWSCHSSSPSSSHWRRISRLCRLLFISFKFYSLLRYLAQGCTRCPYREQAVKHSPIKRRRAAPQTVTIPSHMASLFSPTLALNS